MSADAKELEAAQEAIKARGMGEDEKSTARKAL